MNHFSKNALVTGASVGLGRALAIGLARDGWQLTVDARRPDLLERTRIELARLTTVRTVVGDVADPAHLHALVLAARSLGPIDLVVNNASELGGSPPPRLRDLTPAAARRLFAVNVAGPLELIREVLPALAERAVIVNISSDAAVEHYEGWGGYGASKAALDHLTLTLAAEEPGHTWYAVDPGDLRTAMHQAAFPGEDIRDRPEPDSVVPTLLDLVASGWESGRYRLPELLSRTVMEAS
jgi:NAD(P)-dependent dehydrogenase (short-subunit alcohol dehydrogenase family)